MKIYCQRLLIANTGNEGENEMNINWRYVKPLEDQNLIEEFEYRVGYKFSDTFKKCVMENNGGRPSLSIFDTAKLKERELKLLLSFNKNDKENIWNTNEWVESDVGFGKNLIVFADDNFGNLICFDVSNDNVVFWNHETDTVEFIAKDFNTFFECLHE